MNVSFQNIRNYAERWEWIDERGIRQTGTDIPEKARKSKRIPFFIRYITKEGNVEEGTAVTLSVDTRKRQRKIQFVQSEEIRTVRDYLIIQIDKARFITH